MCWAIVSGAAWLSGMLIAFRLNSVQSNVGDGEEFEYIIAAVVGALVLSIVNAVIQAIVPG